MNPSLTPQIRPALCPKYVLLDLETTGATANSDRITEIALVRVEQGQEVARFSSLVNPGTPISSFIERLTGISNAVVATAPTFEELAEPVKRLLDGCVLVAHNVRFDHGFLKNEFARLGIDLRVKTLCSVRLSRQLYPEFKSHGLDAIMARHGLTTASRHRAMGDVDVVMAWLTQVEQSLGTTALQAAAQKLLVGSTSIPAQLQTPIASIPQSPGVYFFYGDTPLVLYIGKSINLRARVLSHFQSDHRISKDMRIAQEVTRIEWTQTPGELGALLLESRLVKQLQPVYNQQLRRQNQLCTWALADDPNAKPLVQLMGVGAVPSFCNPSLDLARHYGPFRSKRQALDVLRAMANQHHLCPQALGLESGKGRCFAHQIGKCRGVCCGQESAPLHLARLKTALTQYRLAQWPFKGPIGIREHDAHRDCTAIHVFHQWRHWATVSNEDELEGALASQQNALAFDLDTFKLLHQFLDKPANRRALLQF